MSDVRDNMVFGPLRDVSVQYKNEKYLAEKIFPAISVTPKSLLAVYNRGDYFRDEATVRAPGSAAVRGNPTSTTVQIKTQNWAFAGEATDEDRRDATFMNAPPLQPDIDAIEFATEKILIKKEKIVSDHVVAADTVWCAETGGEDCGGLWAAGAGNTFLVDVAGGINTIKINTGMKPNRLLLSWNTFEELKQEATILARIQYSSLGVVTEELLARLVGVDMVIVADAIENTADEGIVDAMTGRFLFEQNAGHGSAFLYYYGSAGLRKPNAGYICTLPNDGFNRALYKFREDARHTDIYEASEEFAVASTFAPYLGKLFTDTILT